MTTKNRTWREAEVEHFRNHPEEVLPYLNIALEEAEKDGDWGAFMASVQIAVEAQGGASGLVQGMESDPHLATLDAILQELGLRLSLQPVAQAAGDEM
jgi:DNA-binding phage protein